MNLLFKEDLKSGVRADGLVASADFVCIVDYQSAITSHKILRIIRI